MDPVAGGVAKLRFKLIKFVGGGGVIVLCG